MGTGRALILACAAACACGTPRVEPTVAAPPRELAAIGCAPATDCFERGRRLFGPDSEPLPDTSRADLERAAGYFVAACDGGLRRGCNAAGNMYRHGSGVARDLAVARDLFRRGCGDDDQEPEACFNVSAVERELGEAASAADRAVPPDRAVPTCVVYPQPGEDASCSHGDVAYDCGHPVTRSTGCTPSSAPRSRGILCCRSDAPPPKNKSGAIDVDLD